MPSPTIADALALPTASPFISVGLAFGQDIREHSFDADLRARPTRAVRRLSPSTSRLPDPRPLQRRNRLRRAALTLIRYGEESRRAPTDGNIHGRLALRRERRSTLEQDRRASRRARSSTSDCRPSDAPAFGVGLDALTRHRVEILRRAAKLEPALLSLAGQSPHQAGARSRARPSAARRSRFSSSSKPSDAEQHPSRPARPSVIVPVLSSTTALNCVRHLKRLAALISTPISAPRPVPTMIAVGVASRARTGKR